MEIQTVIGRLAKHKLEINEVLDYIKNQFVELDELTVGFIHEQKD